MCTRANDCPLIIVSIYIYITCWIGKISEIEIYRSRESHAYRDRRLHQQEHPGESNRKSKTNIGTETADPKANSNIWIQVSNDFSLYALSYKF
jgi:hypothetical protein